MNKLAILPLFFLTMCGTAPVTPPAGAIPQEQMETDMGGIRIYERNMICYKTRTEPDDSINSALENFWEEIDGSNDPTESEELLQLSSDGD